MKTISVEEFRAHVDEYLAATANDDVVLTHDGKPWILLRVIAENGDLDSAAWAHSAEFWRLIQQRRQEQGIPWEEAHKLLELE
jgi:hypothetical protein